MKTWERTPVDSKSIDSFVNHVLDVQGSNVSTKKLNQRDSLFHSINQEISMMGSTAYGLFNGLTHYTTHVNASTNKTYGNSMGHTYKMNKRGYEFLKESVSVSY